MKPENIKSVLIFLIPKVVGSGALGGSKTQVP